MSLRDGPLSDIKPPLTWLVVAILVLALAGSAVLFVGDRRGGGASDARRAVDGALAEVNGVLAVPARWVGAVGDSARDYVLAGSQNRELRRQLAADRALRDENAGLREENARYRALLGVNTDPPLPKVFARTVLDARGPFANTRIADAGADRGVVEGNPVMSENGLVGRVTGVSAKASRIMLLTDIESRTPVLIGRTNGRAILTGDGGPNPKLAYLRTHDTLREGDRLLTSGDGGVLPRGLPVGVVVRGLDGAWRVTLDADSAPIDFVQILLFKDFSQLIPPKALDPSTLPPITTGAPVAPPTPAAIAPPKPTLVKPAPGKPAASKLTTGKSASPPSTPARPAAAKSASVRPAAPKDETR